MGQERDSPPLFSLNDAVVESLKRIPKIGRTPKSSAGWEFAKQLSYSCFANSEGRGRTPSECLIERRGRTPEPPVYKVCRILYSVMACFFPKEWFYILDDLIPTSRFLENACLVIGSLLAFVISLSQVSVGMSLFGIITVLICFFMGSLQVRVCILQIVALVMGLHVRVKEHAQGQSSSGTAGGKGAGNVDEHRNGSRDGGDENGRLGRGINEGRHSGIGGGGQRRGNGDDDDNDGREMVGNVENGGRGNPNLEQIANIFLPIIIQSIAIIMGIDEAQLSTTGRVIRYFSTIINLLGFLCCAAVLCQPHTNPRVARRLNPRIAGLSRTGSALAVLGFISMMAINIPLQLSWVIGLAFLAVLAIFVFDLS